MQKIDDALNIKPNIEVEWEIYLKLVKKFTYNNKSHCTIQHVIDWFRDNVREHGLHRLNFLALSLAPIKLTSANDERVFSFTGKTSSGQRGGMSATKLEQLTIVGRNSDLCLVKTKFETEEFWKRKLPHVRDAAAKNTMPSVRSKNHLKGSTEVSKKTFDFSGFAKQTIPSSKKQKK